MHSSTPILATMFLALVPQCEGSSTSPPSPASHNDRITSSDEPDAAAPNPGGDPDASEGTGEELDVSFAFLGCNRVQKADWDPTSNPSSANVAQLQQTFADVAALDETPKHLFFTGDLVLGLTTDTTVLKGQLDGWAQLYANDPSGIATQTDLVPLVGNHEVLQKLTSTTAKVELVNGAANPVWTTWLGDNGFDTFAGNGPTNAGANEDALEDDESELTYSFDDGDVHYVVLDTDSWTSTPDPATGSTQIGWIALRWLEADLAAAQANAGTKHIFVFGHKPIVSPAVSPAPEDAINATFTSSLEALLGSTNKVRGYLCAHAHRWDARKLPGTGEHDVYQIVAGNGGSKLDVAWTPGFYGFTVANVYTSGRVGITSYQRPVPTPYTGPTEPAVAQAEITISP